MLLGRGTGGHWTLRVFPLLVVIARANAFAGGTFQKSEVSTLDLLVTTGFSSLNGCQKRSNSSSGYLGLHKLVHQKIRKTLNFQFPLSSVFKIIRARNESYNLKRGYQSRLTYSSINIFLQVALK